MARIIDSFKFEHAQWQDFLTKTRKELKQESFYNVMRWYIGATNVNYGLNQLAETFLLRDWRTALVDAIVERSGDAEWSFYREGTFCASGVKAVGIPFTATNFMDGVCRRFHYVVQGTGEFVCVSNPSLSVAYKPGDVLVFDQADYSKQWKNVYEKFTEQVVVCLGKQSERGIKNWELFSQFHNRGAMV